MIIKKTDYKLVEYTLHNHTYLCKHASGDVFEMVVAAKNSGFKYIGISDHVALPIKATTHRMEYEERIDYLNDLNKAKQHYQYQIQDDVRILRGFEAEYQKEYFNIYIEWFKNREIDYLILGQHFEDVNEPHTYFGSRISHEQLTKYVDICIEGMKTGLFLFVAHPDLFMNQIEQFDQICYEQSIRLIKASIEYDVYLEYNAGGIRYSNFFNLKQEDYFYPRYEFWKLVKEYEAKVIVNADAHAPEEIDDYAYQLACQEVVEYDFNLVEKINFKLYYQKINDYINEYSLKK